MERGGQESPKIRILLLGPPIILAGDKFVKLSRKQHRAILFFLAAQSQPVSRTEICDLFWPDVIEAQARKNLREALSRIKKELGASDPFFVTDNQIMLDDSLTYTDKREFDRAITTVLNSVTMNASSSLPDNMVLQLKQIMELNRSPYFLQGVQVKNSPGFENWKELTNHWITYKRLKIIDRLIDHYISAGDLDNALVWIETGLEMDRLNAEMNYLKLTCLRDLGKFQQMIDYINFLDGLYNQNNEQLPGELSELRSKAEISRKIPDPKTSRNWPGSVEDEVPFFGRKTELERLNWAMYRKGIVLLRGEAGIGKTRLIREFYNQQSYSPRLFYCRAQSLTSRLPFHALLDGMQEEIRAEEWDKLTDQERKVLDDYFHDFLIDGNLQDFPNSDEKWFPLHVNVFNGFVGLMESAARKRPVLFVLEDSQWLDPASISIMAYLESKNFFKQHGLLVIVSPLQVNNSPLENWLLQLVRQRRLEYITLQPFTDTEGTDFLHTALGENVNSEYISKLLTCSGGNPFFLLECLQASKMQMADFHKEARFPISPVLQGIVEEKLAAISASGRNVINAAAVLGSHFSPDELEKIIDVDREAMIDALDELTKNGFLKENAGQRMSDEYAFSHTIEQEIIESRLSLARRRYLHQAAAHAILNCKGHRPEISANLAEHFEKAAQPAEAVFYWLAAGRHGRSVFSRTETVHAYERAFDLIQKNSSLFSVSLLYQAFSEWGDYVYDMSDDVNCERIAEHCYRLGELKGEPLLIGAGLSGLGRAAGMRGQIQEAEGNFKRALFELKQANHLPEIIETYARIGFARLIVNDFKNAKEAFEEGAKIGPVSNTDPRMLEARINNLTQLSIVLVYMGWPKRILELAAEMMTYCPYVNRRSASLQAYTIQTLAYYTNGHFREAIHAGLESLEFAKNLQMDFWLSFLDIILGRSYLMTGDLDNAWIHINNAIEREEQKSYRGLFDQAKQALGDIYRMLSENEKAIKIYQEVIDSNQVSVQTIESRLFMGLSLANLGKIHEGTIWIDEARRMASTLGLMGIELTSQLAYILVSSTRTAEEISDEEINQVIHDLHERGGLYENLDARWITGIAAQKRGETRAAIAIFREMDRYCMETGNLLLDFIPLRQIIELVPPKSLESIEAQAQYDQFLKTITEKATIPPIRGMVQKLRMKTQKKWQYFVNGGVV